MGLPFGDACGVFDLVRYRVVTVSEKEVIIRNRCSRRGFLALLGATLLLGGNAASAVEALHIGLTPTFLNERQALIEDWRAYMERKLGRPVAFVLRDSYRETMDMLRQRRIQAAWLCDCPHVTANPEFRLLATPLFHGRPYYQAYLIVPDSDHATRGLADLQGKSFTFTDPYSNSGYLWPRYEISRQGQDPDRYFRRTFFSHSHRNAIEAVAVGLADAASVNSYIWEAMDKQAPVLTGRTRIVSRSLEFGLPPFVTTGAMPEHEFHALREVLIGMAADPTGQTLLEKMDLTGFARPQSEIYRAVRDMVSHMQRKANAPLRSKPSP